MSKVMIHPATYDLVRPAVDRAFELFPLEIRGKTVLIKPNVLRISAAAEGIVTHPAVLRAVVDKVETLGPAAIIVGDNPGLFDYGANEASFEKTGLMEAAKGYYRNIGDYSLQVDFNPDFMPTVSLFPDCPGGRYHHQPAEIQDPWPDRHDRGHQEQLRLFARRPESDAAQGRGQPRTLPRDNRRGVPAPGPRLFPGGRRRRHGGQWPGFPRPAGHRPDPCL